MYKLTQDDWNAIISAEAELWSNNLQTQEVHFQPLQTTGAKTPRLLAYTVYTRKYLASDADYERWYTESDFDFDPPVSQETRWCLYSITKTRKGATEYACLGRGSGPDGKGG